MAVGWLQDPAYEQALEELGRLQAEQARLHAAQTRVLARLAARTSRQGWQGEAPFESLVLDVAGTCVLGQVAASSRLLDAEHLTVRLPRTLELLEGGVLRAHQAQVLVEQTRDLTPDVCAEVEQRVLDRPGEEPGQHAALLAPADLRRLVRRLVLAVDAAEQTRREQQGRRGRRVWVRPLEDGMALLCALLPAGRARQVDLALSDQARAARADGDRRTVDQLRADLLADLLTGTVGQAGAGRPSVHVVVHVPVAAALGLSQEPAELQGYGPISAAHARRLLPGATLTRACHDPRTGRVWALDQPGGRTQGRRREQAAPDLRARLLHLLHAPPPPPPAAEPRHDPGTGLARLVRTRDRRCDGPGCSVPATRCELDHHVPWPAGGTSAENLRARSQRCHHAKHTGWTAHPDPTGTTWTSPPAARTASPAATTLPRGRERRPAPRRVPCPAPPAWQPARVTAHPDPLLPGTAARLLPLAARAQRDGRAPSLVAGVVRDGGLAWSCGRGDVEEPHDDVQYRLGSITKPVTAVAVLRLRDEGRLDLDDPLERHLPGTPFGDRTVGQLLAHVAGVGAESPGPWWERTAGGPLEAYPLSDADRVLAAGRRFHYSNLGFGLLGQLAARLRGRPWEDVVRDEVLLPLGMTRTTPRPSGRAAPGAAVHPWADVVLPEPEHDAGAMAPAGQLWATLADLARFAAFLLGDGGGVLAADTLQEMAVPAGVDASSPGWLAYGLGLQVMRVGERTLLGHGGSMPGFLAMLLVDREEQTGAVVLAGTTSGVDLGLATRLLDVVREAEPHVVAPWTPSPPPVPLDVLGPWYWGPAPYVLRAVAGGLLHLSGLGRQGRTSRFRHLDGDRWLGLDGYFAGEVLEVGPRELRLATFVYTREPYDPQADVPGGVDEGGWR